MDSIPPFDQQV